MPTSLTIRFCIIQIIYSAANFYFVQIHMNEFGTTMFTTLEAEMHTSIEQSHLDQFSFLLHKNKFRKLVTKKVNLHII